MTVAIAEVVEGVLAHYGVRGMHWGIRRTPKQLGAASGKASLPASPDAIRAVETAAKIKAAGSLNVVSSKDLDDLVKRMNLEQKYIKATLEAKTETKKGESFLIKALKNEADQYFIQGKKGPATKLVSSLVEREKAERAKKQAAIKAALAAAAKTATKAGQAYAKHT